MIDAGIHLGFMDGTDKEGSSKQALQMQHLETMQTKDIERTTMRGCDAITCGSPCDAASSVERTLEAAKKAHPDLPPSSQKMDGKSFRIPPHAVSQSSVTTCGFRSPNAFASAVFSSTDKMTHMISPLSTVPLAESIASRFARDTASEGSRRWMDLKVEPGEKLRPECLRRLEWMKMGGA